MLGVNGESKSELHFDGYIHGIKIYKIPLLHIYIFIDRLDRLENMSFRTLFFTTFDLKKRQLHLGACRQRSV